MTRLPVTIFRKMSFVHLHCHSEYSLLDGANRIDDLIRRAQELEQPALAITDHGNLHAAWEFQEKAKKAKVKPILGMEAYVAPADRRTKGRPAPGVKPYFHLVILARDLVGYKNLVKLSSLAYTEGFYTKPRVDRELLAQYSEGLIVSSACLAGEIATKLEAGDTEGAREAASWHADVFKDRFYLEVQAHDSEGQARHNAQILKLGAELNLPIIATNDAHFLKDTDHDAHDVLLCIGLGKDYADQNRMHYDRGLYFKSGPEMQDRFPQRPDVLENTLRIADEAGFAFEKKYYVPSFPLPPEVKSENELLVRLATEGARERYGASLPAEVQERLDYELGVITKTGYAGYFLIVYDFIKAARDRDIPVGPGRGSAAGSIVAYALRITDVCPLKFDLLFERFLNPERVSMPDIDVDFCFERRGEIIEYVRQRYGRESVGQIITFGTLKARAALKDVARLLRIPPADADKLTKLVPSGPAFAMTVEEAAAKVPEIKELVKKDPTYERLFQLASRIEGISRHASVHAAGVVIAPGPLTDYVPVCTQPTKGSGASADGADSIICQLDMIALEKVGMLKMDLLGLKTLTVIHDAVRMVKDRTGVELDMATLPFDDPKVYETLRAGRTAGVFQFESALATETLRAMKCDRFDDLVASNALLRPGPLDAGMHLVFIRRKLGQEKVTYPHESLKEVLEPTYGVITYQEQVMRIANVLAGFSLAEADVLRKAVGKKDSELIKKELGKFVERALAKGLPKKMVEEVSAQIETFGRYGFNKSHSVAYSVLSYQTAWLKAHHPAEFMAALLSSEIGDTDKVVQYIREARELGLEVLPPDVNESGFKFTVIGDTRIRFGLGAVRNVGEGAIASIIAGRREAPYRTLQEFVELIDLRLCNKRVIESLIAAGACDGFGDRAPLTAAVENVLGEAQLAQQEREAGQGTLFGETPAAEHPRAPLPEVRSWTEAERL